MNDMKKLLTLSFLIFHFSFLASYAQNDIWIDINGVRDLTADSIDIANQARPFPGSNRIGNNPVLFLVGNSTMRTGTLGNGNNGQWGWGFYAHEYYDENKITVENHALGGTSPRTFYTLLWKPVLEAVRKGDYVFTTTMVPLTLSVPVPPIVQTANLRCVKIPSPSIIR